MENVKPTEDAIKLFTGKTIRILGKSLVAALAFSAFTVVSAAAADRESDGHRDHAGRVLWQDETTTGYELASAVASSPRWIATAGNRFAPSCVPGSCGIDASLRLYDARSGTLRWTSNYDFGHSLDKYQAVAIEGNIVLAVGYSQNVVSTSGHVWWIANAFDAETGKLLWQDVIGDASTDFYPYQIAIKRGHAYVTGLAGSTCITDDSLSCDQFTRAYDLATGAVEWTTRTDVAGGDDETVSVASEGHMVFIAGQVGAGPTDPTISTNVRALDARTGQLRWEDVIHDDSGHGSVFQVVADEERVVIGAFVNDDWLIRAYDSHSGTVLWSRTYSRTGQATPGVFDVPVQLALRDGVVVAAGYGSTLAFGTEPYPKASRDWVVNAYSAKSGKTLWQDVTGAPNDIDEVDGGVGIVDDQAIALGFVTSADKNGILSKHTLVRSYDLRSGRVRWQDQIERSGFPFGVTITLAASAGRVTAASFVQGTRPAGTPPPASFGRNLLVRTYRVGDD